jgi:hypothetical protein
MSQQGPGGYGGGGPFGPPGGGGYPPGGGAPPPGGYGPPGAPPGPGGYGPPGYGPPQQGYGGYPPPGGPGVPPAKKSKALLWAGIGCGALLVLGIAGGVATYLYMKGQVNDAETAIAAAASAGALGTALPTPAAMGPNCAKAFACCQVTMAKTAAANPALGAQACAALGISPEAACAAQYETLKRAATLSGATCP